MNIYEKLIEIRKSVRYIKKESKGYGYQYTDEMSVMSAVRPKMDELGVILEVDMDEPRILCEWCISNSETPDKKNPEKIYTTNTKQYLMQVGVKFCFINAEEPNEKVQKTIYLQDTAGDPKKMGGLLTYATRYFITKYFTIPTNELDPDQWYNKNDEVSPDQMDSLKKKIKKVGDIKDILEWAEVSEIEDITADQYHTIMMTLEKKERMLKEEKNSA